MDNRGKQLENIVYFELLKRYETINIGLTYHKDGARKTTVIKQIDFYCTKGTESILFQVTNDVDQSYEREINTFEYFKNARKIILHTNEYEAIHGDVEIKDIKK